MYTILSPNMNVPKVIIRHPNAINNILCHLLYVDTLSGPNMSWRRMNPGKRKINEAARPPVRLMMYDMTGTKRARTREMKNQTTLSTLKRSPSLISPPWEEELSLLSFIDGEWSPTSGDLGLQHCHSFITILSRALLRETHKCEGKIKSST